MLTLRLVEEVPDQSKRKELGRKGSRRRVKTAQREGLYPQRAGRVLTLARRRRKAKGKRDKRAVCVRSGLTVAAESAH